MGCGASTAAQQVLTPAVNGKPNWESQNPTKVIAVKPSSRAKQQSFIEDGAALVENSGSVLCEERDDLETAAKGSIAVGSAVGGLAAGIASSAQAAASNGEALNGIGAAGRVTGETLLEMAKVCVCVNLFPNHREFI